jgi:hypothetical protein
MTLARYSDTCANQRDDEADEHNHEAPRNIYAVIANEKELKHKDIKQELNGKSPSSYNTFQGANIWPVDAGQCCNTRLKNDEHTQQRKRPFATFGDVEGEARPCTWTYIVFRNAVIASSTDSFSWVCKGWPTLSMRATVAQGSSVR